MAREVGAKKSKPGALECDYCHGHKGKNKQIVHILTRPDRQTLVTHLTDVFEGNHFLIDFFTALWDSAYLLYSHVAREKQQPLWLIYLEAHGVKVTNRGDAIMRWRDTEKRHEFNLAAAIRRVEVK